MTKTIEEYKTLIKRYEMKSNIIPLLRVSKWSKELDNLQKYIINTHINIDYLIYEMIKVKMWAKIFEEKNITQTLIFRNVIADFFGYIPFSKKIDKLIKLEPKYKKLKNKLEKVNKIRNDFVHKDIYILSEKYNIKTLSGSKNIYESYYLFNFTENSVLDIGLKISDYSDYIKHLKDSKIF